MKNKIFSLLTVVGMLVITQATNQAQALEIEIDSYGVARFWQDQILGKDSAGNAKAGNAQTTKTSPMRTILPREKQVIEIEPKEAGESTVKIRDQYSEEELGEIAAQKAGKKEGVHEERFNRKEEMEAERVELKAQVKSQIQNRKDTIEVQVRSRLENQAGQAGSPTELEIESGEVKARTGAIVTINPETEQLQLITLSGQIHVLNHLPDEALSAMRQSGKLQDVAAIVGEAEIKVEDDGSVKYTARLNQEKRFLGIFKRQVKSEVTLDDQTGEVLEAASEDLSPLARLLDNLSI